MSEEKAGIVDKVFEAFAAEPCMTAILLTVAAAFVLVYAINRSYAANMRDSTKQVFELMQSINTQKKGK